MPASLNKVLLIGNLTRDPELKYTAKGTAIAQIGLAVNRNWKSESGDQKEEVTFIDISVFGRTAESVAQYCKKGKSVLVEGRLKLDQWDDKQTGQKRSKLGVVADAVQFLGGGEGARSQTAAAASQSTPAPAAENNQSPPEDDVPF